MPVILVFVDGVGAGPCDPDSNPLARGEFLLSRFADGSGSPLPHGGSAALVDAALGVPGRPQSATGQTTLFTGENAAAAIGKHLLGYPNAPLRALLRKSSLFLRLSDRRRHAAFANAFPVAYLRALGLSCSGEPEFELEPRRLRMSATTAAFAGGGQPFLTFADAHADRALTHDLTGRRASRFGLDLAPRTPERAAEILAGIAADRDLTLFEFFETDEAGHARSMEQALEVLGRLDRFLRAVAAGLPAGSALLVASDHGNLEDLSTRNHTRAVVPLLGFGRAATRVGEVRDLTGVAPLVEALVEEERAPGDLAGPRPGPV